MIYGLFHFFLMGLAHRLHLGCYPIGYNSWQSEAPNNQPQVRIVYACWPELLFLIPIQVTKLDDMLQLFNTIIYEAPDFGAQVQWNGLIDAIIN